MRGALFHLLKNRVYLGEIPHGAKSYPAAHPPIVAPELFEEVQAMLLAHRQKASAVPIGAAAMPLRGLLFDADGSPMSPSFTRKRNGQIYRYYVSAPLQQGRKPGTTPDAMHRVSADEVEAVLAQELRRRTGADEALALPDLLKAVKRVELTTDAVQLTLSRAAVSRSSLAGCEPHPSEASLAIATLSIRCRIRGGRTFMTAPAGGEAARRVRRDPVLIRALQQGHRVAAAMGWRSTDGSLDGRAVKSPANAHDRKLCCLAFLAPDIQKRIMDGRQPFGMNLERMLSVALPTCWNGQRELFRIAAN